jgi:hypothetical protein
MRLSSAMQAQTYYIICGAGSIGGFSDLDLIQGSAARTDEMDAAVGVPVSVVDGSSVTLISVNATQVTDSFLI